MHDLDRAIRDVEERLQLWRRARDRRLFRRAVEAWCELLEWPSPVVEYALSLDRAHAAHLGRVTAQIEADHRERKKASSTVARVADGMKQVGAVFSDELRSADADFGDVTDQAISKMQTRDYLLIALAVAAAGFVVYRLARGQRHGERAHVPVAVDTQRRILILVVNAGRHAVVDALRAGGGEALQGDQLYKATQALWVGSASEFERTGLEAWFGVDRAVSEQSEYDVHLVRIDLAEDDPGLHRKVNPLDRLDAFRRFQARGFKATVSPRLPSDAYDTTDIYSR